MRIPLYEWQLKGSHSGFWEFGRSMELNRELKGFMPWIPAEVPGSVHGDLHRAGYLPDPYFGTNSLACEWVNDRDWLYRTEFYASPEWKGRRIRLVCEGIDYSAKIRLNGEHIHEHIGMFTPAVAEITPWLRIGETNSLLIGVGKSPDGVAQLGYTNQVDHLKSRFGYKWDFCPRLVNIGLWKPVHLYITGQTRIDDVWVRTDISPESASVRIEAVLESDSGGLAQVSAEIMEFDGLTVHSLTKEVSIRPGLQQVRLHVPIENPRLWWPNGYGEQPLYTLILRIMRDDESAYSEPSDERTVTFGLRSLDFKQSPGTPPDSLAYTVNVNDRDIYLKGWNWVPVDQLYGRERIDQYERLIGLAKAANVNLLRVWGGGLIERERFYDLCDRAGIMVWQEMMQSSSGFNNEPSTKADFMHVLQTTIRHTIREKRNHPSLVIWCGGNELTEEGHLNDRLIPLTDRHPNLRMLRDLAADLDPDRLFLPSSSAGPTFFLERRHTGQGMLYDVHGPWKYAGAREHYALYNESDALLHSEYGGDGFASITSLRKCLPQDMLSTGQSDSMAWLHHGYEYWNMDGQMKELFGEIDSLERIVYLSQWLQAEGIRYGVEANRRRAPRCSGSILWQMNEPFPNISCTSAIDYFGEPKLAYSWVARANRAVHVSLQYDKVVFSSGELFAGTLFLTTDFPLAGPVRVKWSIRDIRGAFLRVEEIEFLSKGALTQQISQITWAIPEGDIPVFFVRAEILDEAGTHILADNQYAFAVTDSHSNTPPLRAFAEMPGTRIVSDLSGDGEKTAIRLKNVGDYAALWPHVRPSSDTLFSIPTGLVLFPGEECKVSVPTSDASKANWEAKGLNIG